MQTYLYDVKVRTYPGRIVDRILAPSPHIASFSVSDIITFIRCVKK